MDLRCVLFWKEKRPKVRLPLGNMGFNLAGPLPSWKRGISKSKREEKALIPKLTKDEASKFQVVNGSAPLPHGVHSLTRKKIRIQRNNALTQTQPETHLIDLLVRLIQTFKRLSELELIPSLRRFHSQLHKLDDFARERHHRNMNENESRLGSILVLKRANNFQIVCFPFGGMTEGVGRACGGDALVVLQRIAGGVFLFSFPATEEIQ